MGRTQKVTANRPLNRRMLGSRAAVIDWLNRRQDFERTPPTVDTRMAFGLSRVRRLLAALGSPHQQLRVVHVAGTKGKGSTVTMVAEILAAAGHRVGRYTSPHVHRLEERICVAGREIGPTDLVAAFNTVIPAVEELDRAAGSHRHRRPTWFEAVTAAAFIHFVNAKADVVVLETGLGGRLDATNVCDPLVSIITSVSLDHMALLGRTVGRIAAEKAGIIKRGRPVISGASHPAARRVIAHTATRRRTRLFQLHRDFQVSWQPADAADPLAGGIVEICAPVVGIEQPLRTTLAMAGRHQADNAALAVMAALVLDTRGIAVSRGAIERGLARARLPARIERVAEAPTIVVDAAHNVASMQSLIDALAPLLDGHRKRALVFAASADKQIEQMIAVAAGRFDTVVVTRYTSSCRSAPIERLVTACREAGLAEPRVAANPRQAIRIATSCVGRHGVVCVAGSFFLAAEVGVRT